MRVVNGGGHLRSAAGFTLLLLGSLAPVAGQAAPATKPVAAAAKAPPAATAAAQPTRSSLAIARARAASAERARASALTRLQRDAMTPHFKSDVLGNLVPDISASSAAAIVYNPETREVLWEENSHAERSIASLTKLMTVVTFVADDPDLSQRVTVTRADMRNASVTHLATGETISYNDLLHLALIASDNAAARVLARTSEGGTGAFVRRMNEMASHLMLADSHFTEPSGLDSSNVSSAYDLSQLIAFAGQDPRLGPIMRTAEYEVHPSFGALTIHSTNKLLGTDLDVRGGKTGFISKAGYCLATLLQIPHGSQIAVVVLGAANSTMRFWDARHLFNWVVGRAQGIVGGDESNQIRNR